MELPTCDARPSHTTYGGEDVDDEVISKFNRFLIGLTAACVLVSRRSTRLRGILARAAAIARMALTRGALVMATTAAAVTRGHVPSHQQQYNVPVRPPTVQVWQLQRYPYLQDGYLTSMRYSERMVQETFYQFPAALDSGEFRTRNDMLHELFKASALGDRGVKFAYWHEHGTISAPLPTTYDQLQRWIMAADFSQSSLLHKRRYA